MHHINWKDKLKLTGIILLVVTAMYVFQIGCPIRRITTFPCMGCGMTRAVISLLKLDFAAAFEYHAMVWSLPLLYYIFLTDGKVFRRKWLNGLLIGCLIAGFLVNWGWKLFA